MTGSLFINPFGKGNSLVQVFENEPRNSVGRFIKKILLIVRL